MVFMSIAINSIRTILYWQFQGGKIARYYKKTGEYKSLMPFKDEGTEDLRFNWNTPLIFSPTSNRFYTGCPIPL